MSQYTVAAVYSPAPDAQVGVDLGGDGQNVATAYATGLGYQPQTGDVVDVEKRGSGLVVTRCLTPGRTYPPPVSVPILTVVDTPPTNPSWSQTAAWVLTGSNPLQVQFVRAAPPTPPPVTPTATVLPLTGNAGWASYDTTNGWAQRSPAIRQGNDFGLGPAYGLFFYGTGAFTLTGTVSSATIDLVRDPQSGSPWAAKTVYLIAHGYPTVPGGAPTVLAGPTAVTTLAVNQGARVTIPAPMVALLKAGTAKGLGIYSAGSDDYLALRPSADAAPAGGDYRNGRCRFAF